MLNNFIEKLKTNNFSIGSYDSFINETNEIIKKNSSLTDKEVEEILDKIHINNKASVVDKDGNYIGFIGLYNIDSKVQTFSLRLELKEDLSRDNKDEIIDEFKKWAKESLNLIYLKELIINSPTIKDKFNYEINLELPKIVLSNSLEQNIDDKTINYFKDMYDIPNLELSCTMKIEDMVVGLIGLTNLLWANKRANLVLFLDRENIKDINLISKIVDEYLDYVHSSNVYNVTISIPASDIILLDIIKNTNMNYYGYIPFGAINGNSVESMYLFQHMPDMFNDKNIILPKNISIDISVFDTSKKDMDKIVDLGDGYRLVSPKELEREHINTDKIIHSFMNIMQERERFTIPLGEDKYIIQKELGKYSIVTKIMEYSYLILDNDNNFVGFVSILRTNANKRNAEIEVGINSNIQHKGLGTRVINKFYEELFKIGYASVTSYVFSFNIPSNKLFKKLAELNGTRLQSYYINGKLWDINIYTKVNDKIKERLS